MSLERILKKKNNYTNNKYFKKRILLDLIQLILFLRENLKKYDVIVGMFHDQVLAPFKALFGFDAINITLGLPYIRMSPDHGVAEDKKKLNISNPKSLNRCIEIMSKIH